RWNDLGDDEIYHGEMWTAVVLAGWVWMMAWNFARTWLFKVESIEFPEDYQFAAMETIVMYTLSAISSFLHKYKAAPAAKPKHHKAHKAVHHAESPIEVPSGILEALPAKGPSKGDVILVKSPAPLPPEAQKPPQEPQEPHGSGI
ncbi:MAG: hypothetical protein Q7S28_03290, partial [bacterium]|nr:hypothetical protein [bacterium]